MDFDDFDKRNPHLKEVSAFVRKLNDESDRGAALISCGFLEEQLREILVAFFRPGKKAKQLVEGAFAPLGTFSARISACHALGLITDVERAELDLLRAIRNEFAHSIHTSFATPSIVDRCATLKFKAEAVHPRTGKPAKIPVKAMFTTSAIALIGQFVNRPYYVSQERRTEKDWEY